MDENALMAVESLIIMDYMEQPSCPCFKSFEETENNLEVEAAYASAGLSTGNGWAYERILASDYRWSAWAGPGRGLTGDR